jgi:uncharacterized protein (DUF362 family)/NAD-dependent dihydropyrimidine dehydrogenase PreA subunit
MADLIREAGGQVYIGDGPGSDEQEYAHRVAGYEKICEETGAKLLIFREIIESVAPNTPSLILPLAAELEQVDLVINAAKFKTHPLTGMTAAVKNMYGVVAGKNKKRFHLEHPLPLDFSRVLIEVCLAAKPAFSIIDAVVAMEGLGPRRGKPRQVGLLLGSVNPFALDHVMAEIAGFRTEQVTTLMVAEQMNIPGSKSEEITVHGLNTDQCFLKNFDRGALTEGRVNRLLTNLPLAWLRNMLYARRPYPYIDQEFCTSCGECLENCPLQIITAEGKIPEIDHYECIRCYCCQEVCASGAIKLSRNIIT